MAQEGEQTGGRHRRLYEESLVRNIMLATAYCIKDLIEDNEELNDEDIYEFLEENYRGIIQDTLEEFQRQGDALPEEGEEGPKEDGEIEDEPSTGEETP